MINPFPTERAVALPGTGWSRHADSPDALTSAMTVPPRSVVVLER